MMIRRHFRVAGLLTVVLCLIALSRPARAERFPPGGEDVLPGTVTLGIELNPRFTGHPEPILTTAWFSGDTIVRRSDPVAPIGLPPVIETEILSMDLVGGVGGWPMDVVWPAELHLQPDPPSTGWIEANPDPDDDFPASSLFDIFFEIHVADTTWGDLVLTSHGPLRMVSTIDAIPPDLGRTPYVPPDFGLPLPLVTHNIVNVGLVVSAVHAPEPGTLTLLMLGALVLGEWTISCRRRQRQPANR